jgi:hypothetical protein
MERTFANLLDQVEVHEGSPVMAKKKRRLRFTLAGVAATWSLVVANPCVIDSYR